MIPNARCKRCFQMEPDNWREVDGIWSCDCSRIVMKIDDATFEILTKRLEDLDKDLKEAVHPSEKNAARRQMEINQNLLYGKQF